MFFYLSFWIMYICSMKLELLDLDLDGVIRCYNLFFCLEVGSRNELVYVGFECCN